MSQEFKEKLKKKMDDFVDAIFDAAVEFPKEELYVTTAQLKRAALSVMLNYVEGYARRRPKMQHHFWEISFGSLKESIALIHFSKRRTFLPEDDAIRLGKQADEIGAMLWLEIIDREKLIGNQLN